MWYGAWAEKRPNELIANTKELGAMIAAGSIKPRYSAGFALNDFADAFRLIAERRALGKVVLLMSGPG